MRSINFDRIIDRHNTGSTKWDKYKGEDIIPLWVADMDFASPQAILDALHERIDHGVFGYSHLAPAELVDATLSYLERSYNWQVEPEWLVWLPGLVCGLNVTCRALTLAADDVSVLTATPVYYHLFKAPANFNIEPICVPMAHAGERWALDLPSLERAITPTTQMFMLCNPHNPVGRVYSRDELLALAELCEKHDLLICSDEIHCQLVLDQDKQHIPIAALSSSIAERTITLMAPSKTYNIPSLGCAFAIIANAELRQQFVTAKTGIVPHVNVLGYTATLAAYRYGDEWLQQLLDYLRGNLALVQQAVAELPGISISPVEATYLAWLDTKALPLPTATPTEFFEQAGIGFSDGSNYQGAGFIRLNFACPRSRLEQALSRMEKSLRYYQGNH